MSRPALWPTQSPIQWLPGALFPVVKHLGSEADHSLPSSAEIRNVWCYTPTPHYVFLVWCLVKHRDSFTFTFVNHVSLKLVRHKLFGSTDVGPLYVTDISITL
jgi:hypothetical protein